MVYYQSNLGSAKFQMSSVVSTDNAYLGRVLHIYLCASMALYKIRGYPTTPAPLALTLRTNPCPFLPFSPIPNPAYFIFMSPIDGATVVGSVRMHEYSQYRI
jgi:hypothetical protein